MRLRQRTIRLLRRQTQFRLRLRLTPRSSKIPYMKNTWIDGHCHLADPRLSEGMDALVAQSRAFGVTGWVQGGVDPQDWNRQRALRGRVGEGVVLAFGLHPWWVARATPEQVAASLVLLENELPEAAALGETGLDAYPIHGGNLPLQTTAFEAQLLLALKYDKPLVLHVVQAHAKCLELLKKHGPFARGGLVHAFGGSLEIARNYLALGLTLSVGNGVSKPGYKALKAALPHLPPDRLVVETDCPDGAADPSGLLAVAEAVGKLQNRRAEDVLDTSTAALKALFRM
jgi:TatD DNase family protein